MNRGCNYSFSVVLDSNDENEKDSPTVMMSDLKTADQ